jgi:hypothetical protein
METKTRKILFLICLFLFLVITPLAVLYSQGYRIDFKTKKITQTGGLFLKILPKSTEIYLDSKLKKKTDFFFGSALIENLLPKKYKVLIRKDGFHSWEKELQVKERMVTSVEYIILFPQNPKFNFLTQKVEKFWFSPDQKKIILKETGEEGWSLKLYDIQKNIKSHLIQEKDIYAKGADLLNLEFSDNTEISLEIGMKEQIKHFTLDLTTIPPLLTEKEEELLPFNNIVTYKKLNEEIFYLDNRGNLFKTNKEFELKEKLTEIPFSLSPETEYGLEKFNDFIFLKENMDLYWLNPESNSFEKFFDSINGLKISPDQGKLVYFSNYETWILFLKEKQDQPSKRAGEKTFLFRLSEKIEDVAWLNSHYLIFTVGNKIKITEIDDRDRINVIDLADFENPQIFFNNTDKKLYLLSNEKLHQSQPLIP